MQRRLAAILAADMVGYSRLIERDEAGTIERLKADRESLVDPAVAAHNGQIVRMAGDGALVEFPSVVEAVQCALDIQQGMPKRNQGRADDQRIVFRIGVSLGDIVVEDDNLHGEGINIAARLESLAEPGGILMSEEVARHVDGKVSARVRFVKERTVKNIERPLRIWRVESGADTSSSKGASEVRPRQQHWRYALLLAAGVAGVTGAMLWYQPWMPKVEAARVERMAYPLPDKPSIAVLPFKNLSADLDQEYLAEAIAEDIVTDLSKVSGIFVVASNSSFAYKENSVPLRRVAEELGVQYVLQGSVQRSGNRLRLSARLVDVVTGNHLWGERYDRELKELFSVQTEVSEEVSKALAVTLTANDVERLYQKYTSSIDAYDVYLRARRTTNSPSLANVERGEELYRRVIELDPDFAGGYAGLSYLYNVRARFRYGPSPELYRAKALELARKAVEVDSGFAWAHIALGGAHLANRDPVAAVDAARAALALEPNGYDANLYMGFYLQFAGEPALAVEHAERAKRLSPVDTVRNLAFLGRAYFMNGDYDKAVEAWTRRYREFPVSSPNGFVYLAAAYALLGRPEDASNTARKLIEAFPGFQLSEWRYINLYKSDKDRSRLYEAARKAGIPEHPKRSG